MKRQPICGNVGRTGIINVHVGLRFLSVLDTRPVQKLIGPWNRKFIVADFPLAITIFCGGIPIEAA